MLILKRLTVWFVETCFEVLLLGLAIVGMFGYSDPDLGRDVGLAVSAMLLLSYTTGYLFTTVVARVVWQGQKLWPYSVVATMLFLVHSQVFFLSTGVDQRDLENISVELAGCCVVFACTLAGTFALRKWAPARRLAEPGP